MRVQTLRIYERALRVSEAIAKQRAAVATPGCELGGQS